jgi:hypothetical protein
MDEHNKKKMTRQQAGKQGGLAPHKCRGRQCNNRTKSASNESTSASTMHAGNHTKSGSDFDGSCSW